MAQAGQLRGSPIWRVAATEILPLKAANSFPQVRWAAAHRAATPHLTSVLDRVDFPDPRLPWALRAPPSRSMNAQLLTAACRARAPAAPQASPEEVAAERNFARLLATGVREAQLYFCYQQDITQAAQAAQADAPAPTSTSGHGCAEPRFLWNAHVAGPLWTAGASRFTLPVVCGFVGSAVIDAGRAAGTEARARVSALLVRQLSAAWTCRQHSSSASPLLLHF